MGIELVQLTIHNGRGVEDGMTAMHHMVIERQHHQRGIGRDPAQDARVHGGKIRGFLMHALLQPGNGFFSG